MAIDTRSKRASVLGIGLIAALTLPLADGTVEGRDRQSVAFAYSGIAASAPAGVTAARGRRRFNGVWTQPDRYVTGGAAAGIAPAAGIIVECDFGSHGNGWIDITTDVTSATMHTSRRFQSTAPTDLMMAPPTWTFELNNSASNSVHLQGAYSPDSANRRAGWGLEVGLRYRHTANGVTRTRFIGWLEDFTPVEGTYGDQTVSCLVVGWLGQAATTGVSGLSAAVNQRGDQLFQTLVALTALPPWAAPSVAQGIDTYPYSFDDLDPAKSTVADGIDSVVRSGFDRVWEKADGTPVYENRRTRGSYKAPVLTLTDVAPSPATQPGLALTAAPGQRQRGKAGTLYQVTGHPKGVDLAPVVLYSLPVSASDPPIGIGQTVTFQAPYVDPNQKAQSVGGFNMLISDGAGGSVVGTSGSLPTGNFSFFSAPNAGGTNLSGSVLVTVVYGVNQATITMTNNAGVPVYRNVLQCTGQGIYNYQTVIGTASTTPSASPAAQNVVSIDCPYNPDPAFVANAAKYCVLAFSPTKTQLDRGVQVFVPATDEVTMDALFQRDISDSVAISETVLGLSANPYWINGEECEIDERGNILFTYPLALNLAGIVWTAGIAGAGEAGTVTVPGF